MRRDFREAEAPALKAKRSNTNLKDRDHRVTLAILRVAPMPVSILISLGSSRAIGNNLLHNSFNLRLPFPRV